LDGLGVISGISVAEVVAVGEELYDEVLSHRIFPGTKQLLDQHQAAGHEVWLVSASPVEIGSLMAVRFGATGALGTVPDRKDGFYTGRLVGGLLHGPAKADAVIRLATERGIDLTSSFAYGDSIADVALLSTVGHACGINPDRRLRRYCARHGWPVRDFRGRRRAVRRSLNTAWRLGATWALFSVARAVVRRLWRGYARRIGKAGPDPGAPLIAPPRAPGSGCLRADPGGRSRAGCATASSAHRQKRFKTAALPPAH
jgi:HAD superfamily hydrolase (TIGR01490 family)